MDIKTFLGDNYSVLPHILKCPFCGKKPCNIITDKRGERGYILCRCGAFGPSVQVFSEYSNYDWKVSVINAWNKRNK
jgi:Lar family restriction alleviation protein